MNPSFRSTGSSSTPESFFMASSMLGGSKLELGETGMELSELEYRGSLAFEDEKEMAMGDVVDASSHIEVADDGEASRVRGEEDETDRRGLRPRAAGLVQASSSVVTELRAATNLGSSNGRISRMVGDFQSSSTLLCPPDR